MSKDIDILNHPDKEDIISKLISGISAKDIHEELKSKYTLAKTKKFVLSENSLENFKNTNITLYQDLKADTAKLKILENTPKEEINIDHEIELSVKNNPTYRQKLEEMINTEVDIKLHAKKLLARLEMRVDQICESIQDDPTNIGKKDYVLIQYINTLTSAIEKADKVINHAPDQIIQHNITLQAVDQHIAIFQEAIREVLAELDYSVSLKFYDILNEKLKKLKPENRQDTYNYENRLADAQIISEKLLLAK